MIVLRQKEYSNKSDYDRVNRHYSILLRKTKNYFILSKKNNPLSNISKGDILVSSLDQAISNYSDGIYTVYRLSKEIPYDQVKLSDTMNSFIYQGSQKIKLDKRYLIEIKDGKYEIIDIYTK